MTSQSQNEKMFSQQDIQKVLGAREKVNDLSALRALIMVPGTLLTSLLTCVVLFGVFFQNFPKNNPGTTFIIIAIASILSMMLMSCLCIRFIEPRVRTVKDKYPHAFL